MHLLKNNWLIITIILLAASLRFYQLGHNPPSLDWDETAHGYNAYSILKTTKDEYGKFLPLYFRSFDDYKPPLYTYLVIPSVAAFGLSDFAVRFPSALLGVAAVLFTYLMVFELFRNKTIGLLSAFFLAVSPWHLQFSRVAFETNSAIFWSVFGTWAFLKGTRSQDLKIIWWMTVAALAFGLNLFMYHNARVFIPIFSLSLLILFRQKLIQNFRYLILPTVVSLAFIAALLPIITSVAGQLRFKGTAIFADVSPQYKASALIVQDQQQDATAIGKILHNRRFVYLPILLENYLSHFRITYLFQTADMERHHAPLVGLLYLWDLPFILAGIFFTLSKNFDFKAKIIIFWWFLTAPIASSVTWGVPHALRSEIYLPTYQIFTAIGLYTLYSHFKKTRLILPILLLFLLNFAFYLHQYYIHMPTEYSRAWLYGRKQAAEFTEQVKHQYERVIVSTKLEQPHEFWLYYTKYDPASYQREGGTVSGGFLEDRNKFDKYLFKPIDFRIQSHEAKTLFVGLPSEFPKDAVILKKINYLNNQPAIYILSGQ